jgi:hypothetical protein
VLDGIGDSSDINPYEIVVGPAVIDCGVMESALTVPQYVSVNGSGDNTTVIMGQWEAPAGSGMVILSEGAALRSMSVLSDLFAPANVVVQFAATAQIKDVYIYGSLPGRIAEGVEGVVIRDSELLGVFGIPLRLDANAGVLIMGTTLWGPPAMGKGASATCRSTYSTYTAELSISCVP